MIANNNHANHTIIFITRMNKLAGCEQKTMDY